MPIDLTSFQTKSLDQLITDWLNTYAEYLQQNGNRAPNTAKGTEIYGRALSTCLQIAVAQSNTQILANALMPDSAEDGDLERIAAIDALFLRSAGPSFGSIIFALSIDSAVLVPEGYQLVDTNGQAYKVTVGGSYFNNQAIPIASISTGSATNIAAGTILKWVSPPALASASVSVASPGMSGGVDAEDIEALRKRLFALYQDPPGGGNASQVNLWAEASSTVVQKSFCHPCANGPATVHVVVVRAPTSTDKSRDVDSVVINTTIAPYLTAQIPEWVSLTVSTVSNQSADVSIGLSLPQSSQAGGPGGGWVNATPFPVSGNSVSVSSVVSATVFSVPSTVAPSAGITQIAWLDRSAWVLKTATVVSFTGSGPYTLTIDTPFTGIAPGDWVMPNAIQIQNYIAAVLNFFEGMGPGECTSIPGLLPRAIRSPSALLSFPSSIGPSLLRALEDAGEEVLDSAFLSVSQSVPSIPSSPLSATNIMTPNKIAFYPI